MASDKNETRAQAKKISSSMKAKNLYS